VDRGTSLRVTSDAFRFSAAVAQFGLLLRDSEHKAEASYPNVLALARGARGADEHGYRAEFIRLVETAEVISTAEVATR
jgi:Ca-activated chloride channel family protein